MTAKHTPNPWIISGQNILAGDGIGIAKVYDNVGQPREANARLIAAAPELLAELEALAEQLDVWFDQGDAAAEPPDTKDAKSAIHKARGE